MFYIKFKLFKKYLNNTCWARLWSSWAIADPRSVFDTGWHGRLAGTTGAQTGTSSGNLIGGGTIVDVNDMVDDAGSQEDVDNDEEVDAQSLPHDSRLDSVSVEPVLPIDTVLPICLFITIIGFESVTNKLIKKC